MLWHRILARQLAALAFLALALCGAEAASRFGVCTVTCTWDASSTAMWSATSGGASGASVPGSGDTVVFDAATCVGGVTCTITPNTTISVQSITMGACTASTTGCVLDFSVNNNNVNLSLSFSGTGTGTRVLRLGNGTWTISGTTTNTPWTIATTTNLTFAANSSVINMTAAFSTGALAFSGGSLTYNTVNFAANNAVAISGSNTFTNLGVTGPNAISWASAATNIITNAPTIVGTPSAQVLFYGSNTTSTISIASGTASFAWTSFSRMIFSGGATFTASNSADLGLNTGITITPPSTGGSASGALRPGLQ